MILSSSLFRTECLASDSHILRSCWQQILRKYLLYIEALSGARLAQLLLISEIILKTHFTQIARVYKTFVFKVSRSTFHFQSPNLFKTV